MSASTTRQFHTQCQEEVYRQVKSYLDELVDEHFDDAEHCDFYLKYGSTVLEISIDPYEEDDAVIEVLAFCVQGAEPSFDLMQELLRLNSQLRIGAFSMVDRDIFFSHSFLGRRLQGEQLIASLNAVANISDDFDERLVAKYGGVGRGIHQREAGIRFGLVAACAHHRRSTNSHRALGVRHLEFQVGEGERLRG